MPWQKTARVTTAELKDKIKGAWAAQTIGVTYGGPTEFRFRRTTIPDSMEIAWSDSMMYRWMTERPGLYDDIYMDLTFVDVMEKHGINAPASLHAEAYANAEYPLWHANQQGRYNILHGIMPPESGHWMNNPHADDIDFQIEADFAGIMSPGMPLAAASICDRVGHIMNYGDGYYGGVFVAAMYSYAFIMDNVHDIVENALRLIPEESTYYQCIRDVIRWHREYPNNWREAWQEIEDTWGKDVGCPDGVLEPFNIDAKLNSAYVVLGLLYGNGDLSKTMEIATRAGQDSDCNPATAGGILGTVLGYQGIPEYWSAGLSLIENLEFKYTDVSLNDVYAISYNHALQVIAGNGGTVGEDHVVIRVQKPVPVPLEQGFPGYRARVKVPIDRRITEAGEAVFRIKFEGVGVVVQGVAGDVVLEGGALEDEAATMRKERALTAEFYIDGSPAKVVDLPVSWLRRSPELFFQYALDPGVHTLTMRVPDLPEGTYIDIGSLIAYDR